MKEVRVFCDRCQQPIYSQSAMVTDFLHEQYPGEDICEACDLEITLAMQVQRQATLQRVSPQIILQAWLARYENPSLDSAEAKREN